MTTRFLIMIVSATSILAACGGGGGSGETPTGSRETLPDPDSPDIIQPDSAPSQSGLRQAANSIPLLGRRSVSQSSNVDRENTTTDAVTGVFDRGHFELAITQQDGTSIILSSQEHVAQQLVAVPVRANQIAERWTLQSGSAGVTITAKAFGESPADEPFRILRAIHAGGNWGTHGQVVEDWEARNRSGYLVPQEHMHYLKSLNVNWVGLSVALHYDDSVDSTVERVYSPDGGNIATFQDDVLRQFIREFRSQGIDVYLTLAFESRDAEHSERPVHRWQLGNPDVPDTGITLSNWPWSPDHPDHERFVAEFWKTYADQAVHFARLAEEEGARMFSLGTETDSLFRTRSGDWPNHFREELEDMVARVREVFSGKLTYDMHYTVLTANDYYGPGLNNLWEDLGLDVVGVSNWFPVAETVPTTVPSVDVLQERYEKIFREYFIPLAQRNSGRPIVLLEHGATDEIWSPADPARSDASEFEFTDRNGNGLDDGRETQANMYQALLNTMARYPGTVDGVFLWDNWVSSDEGWYEFWTTHRSYPIRGKLAEDVVRHAYEAWAEWLTGGHWMQVSDDGSVDAAGAFVDAPELAGTPTLPTVGTASYQGIATGGYVLLYGDDFSDVSPGSHEIGDYEGGLELTADFTTGHIDGRVHSIEVSGMHTPVNGGTRSFNGVSVPYEIVLETTTFNSGGFTGNTSVTSSEVNHGIADSKGSWGGKFSTIPNSDGSPRLIAGTHGAEFTAVAGTEGSFIGVFVGTTD
ncbi:MAG: hypothetical protein OXI95_14180 [bacterium]|nr:hypothetical protein [bacterium]